MFNTVTEEQYLNVIIKAGDVYQKEVHIGSDDKLRTYQLNHERIRMSHAISKHKRDFESEEQKLLFILNLVISDNETFLEKLLRICKKHINQDGLEEVLRYYPKRSEMKGYWDGIYKDICKIYHVKEEVASLKIEELLTFSYIYNKNVENELDAPAKSLSIW